MPDFLHRTTKAFSRSVSYSDLPEPLGNYIEQPDLSAVAGFPSKYWVITGDAVTLMDQAARDVVDAAELSDELDDIADEIDQNRTYTKGFALAVIDEFNNISDKINAILDAIDNANNLSSLKDAIALINNRPQRTPAQLKTAIRNKLNT